MKKQTAGDRIVPFEGTLFGADGNQEKSTKQGGPLLCHTHIWIEFSWGYHQRGFYADKGIPTVQKLKFGWKLPPPAGTKGGSFLLANHFGTMQNKPTVSLNVHHCVEVKTEICLQAPVHKPA